MMLILFEQLPLSFFLLSILIELVLNCSTINFFQVMSESVTVAVRVRPLNAKEKKEKCTEIHQINGKSITVTSPETYAFIFCNLHSYVTIFL